MVISTASQFARCLILSEPLASVTDWWLCSVFYRVSPFLAWADFHALAFRSLYYP